jgi:hypothetical protein
MAKASAAHDQHYQAENGLIRHILRHPISPYSSIMRAQNGGIV